MGTPKTSVAPRGRAARAASRRCPRWCSVPPRRSGPSTPSTSPCTWNSGRAWASRSSAVHAHAVGERVEVGRDAPPGQHGALRRAGGAGGVDHERRVGLRAARAGRRPRVRRAAVGCRRRCAAGRTAARHRVRRAPRSGAASASSCASSRSPQPRVDRHRGHAREERRDDPDGGVAASASPTPRRGAARRCAARGHPRPRELAVGQRRRWRRRRAEAQRDLVGRVSSGQQTAHPTTLPGLRMPCGSRAALTARCIASTDRPELALHARPLEQPDAVLAGHGAAEVDRGVDDRPRTRPAPARSRRRRPAG